MLDKAGMLVHNVVLANKKEETNENYFLLMI